MFVFLIDSSFIICFQTFVNRCKNALEFYLYSTKFLPLPLVADNYSLGELSPSSSIIYFAIEYNEKPLSVKFIASWVRRCFRNMLQPFSAKTQLTFFGAFSARSLSFFTWFLKFQKTWTCIYCIPKRPLLLRHNYVAQSLLYTTTLLIFFK